MSAAASLPRTCLSTARSREAENQHGHRNAKRNPSWNSWNQETIVLGLFSFEILKRDLAR